VLSRVPKDEGLGATGRKFDRIGVPKYAVLSQERLIHDAQYSNDPRLVVRGHNAVFLFSSGAISSASSARTEQPPKPNQPRWVNYVLDLRSGLCLGLVDRIQEESLSEDMGNGSQLDLYSDDALQLRVRFLDPARQEPGLPCQLFDHICPGNRRRIYILEPFARSTKTGCFRPLIKPMPVRSVPLAARYFAR